tara:strand:- start:23 stop:163 length:141 start_codon:yes stop_codon:yes gene_type:complete
MHQYFDKKIMKDYNNIKTFDELIELEHGKIGTEIEINTRKVHKCLS